MEQNYLLRSWKKPDTLWNEKVQYCDHNSPPLNPVFSHMNAIHILTPYFCKNHINITLPSTRRSSKGLFPWGFPDKILYAFLISPTRIILLDLITLITFGKEYTLWHPWLVLFSILCYFRSSAPCSQTHSFFVASFEAFTAVILQIEVWVMTPSNVAAGYQRFRGPCCLHLRIFKTLVSTQQHNMASLPRRPRLEALESLFFP
jgi:hypothetical protein